jgi:ubiquitin carboxyl-terminal hydrolase 34
MVLHVTKVASRIENIEGKEFLQFYKDVVNLEDNKNDIPREEIIKICLEQVPSWAPGLLNCYDGSVREGTEAFLAEILLRYGPQVELGTSAAEVEKANTILQVAQKLGVACLDYLNEVYVRLRQPAVRASLESILNVIATCTTYFDEEARDPLTRRFFEMRSSKYWLQWTPSKLTNSSIAVLPALKRFTVEEVDEEVSGMSDTSFNSSRY